MMKRDESCVIWAVELSSQNEHTWVRSKNAVIPSRKRRRGTSQCSAMFSTSEAVVAHARDDKSCGMKRLRQYIVDVRANELHALGLPRVVQFVVLGSYYV